MAEFFSKLSKRQRNPVENFKTQSGRGGGILLYRAKLSISSHFFQILTHFEFISSPKHTFQGRRTSSVRFESLIYVPDGLKSFSGVTNKYFGETSTHKAKRHQVYT